MREFVHTVQERGATSGLEVTDRVALVVTGPEEALAALREHEDYIAEEVLANDRVGRRDR